MNEMDVLDLFYDELRAEGKTRLTLFISLDELAAAKLSEKLGVEVTLKTLHKLADICIANEWLERTTADLEYRYLSLTEAGLNMAVNYQYIARKKTSE
ncbi:hypothetical protein [Legionella worsleiensis]|uniref:Uncharacterized protein n=1 Tax=Legionella worsleiensis TaxID=45076 RepID=A0A0W1A6G6_9GAMM|nr:hypothetical protein [Legionella worsleiensis]KTD76800.1 hypothetical protein Lwor_2025 [Legionella worsleiensis]STY30641.1 Uncharacterised protein [Legionella worsleiensis]